VDRGDNEMTTTNKSMAIVAVVAALALLGVVVTIASITLQQEAEAKGVCGTSGLLRSAIHSGNRSLISCAP
jgi:hypothetical protein